MSNMRRHSNERRTDNVRHSLRREREKKKNEVNLFLFLLLCLSSSFILRKEILIDEYDISFVLDNVLLFLNLSSISNYFFN